MEIKDKRIIVTGGNGFLGRHLIKCLIENGVKKENIFSPSRAKYDLTKIESVQNLFKDFSADIVIHLATNSGGVQYYKENPAKIFYDNLTMGSNLIEVSRLNNIKKFVLIGTGLIYPKDAPIPLKESSIWEGYPEENAAAYGLASRMHLALSQAYRKQYNFNSIYLILPNLYGPEDHFDERRAHVIPSLINRFNNAIKENKKSIEFWGSGNASREFLYVSDAAIAIISALKDYDSPEPINIGPGEEIKIKNLAEKIGSLMGYKGDIKRDESKPEGQLRRCFDVSKMQSKLNFKPKTSLDIGLNNTITWFRDNES